MKKLIFVLGISVGQLVYAQQFEWAAKIGNNFGDVGYSIATDASGNVYTTGFIFSTVDMDPGTATFNLTSAGGSDVFISKLDASGNFVWAKRIGGTTNEQGHSIAIDSSGNVYVSGFFTGTVDFDPGNGTSNLTADGQSDIFFCKLNALGNFVWARKIGGRNGDYDYSMALDDAGNVYFTGHFQDTVDFDPGSGIFNLVAMEFPFLSDPDAKDIVVGKLDASGNFMWAKQFNGPLDEYGYSIAVDDSGNAYITGLYSWQTDFDPDTGLFVLTSDINEWNAFVAKLDHSGNLVWAKGWGNNGHESGMSVALDAAHNVYITGEFGLTADFDPGPGVFNLTSSAPAGGSVYLSKLDAAGNFQWATIVNTRPDTYDNTLAVDPAGNVYLVGYFSNSQDFDPGTSIFTLTSAGYSDVAILKLNTSGNFQWVVQMGGDSSDLGFSIAVSPSGSIYATGYFYDTSDFDPGPGVFNLTAISADGFIVRLTDTTGTAMFSLSGTVLTESGYLVPGVTLRLNGSSSDFSMTGVDGRYTFDVFAGGTYTITPSKSNDITPNNGISTSDVLLTRRHILGTPLSTPYKIIAADVDGSGSVSTLDILQMRSMILGNITMFPNGLWQFVPSDHVFPDQQSPFPYPTSRTYTNLQQSLPDQNFIGIKLGDVNASWDPNNP